MLKESLLLCGIIAVKLLRSCVLDETLPNKVSCSLLIHGRCLVTDIPARIFLYSTI
jgi:hypothetical protein